MLHDPHADPFKATTHELICALIGRLDTSNSLHALLALMVEMSVHIPVRSPVAHGWITARRGGHDRAKTSGA